MKTYPRPLSDEFIAASPERLRDDYCLWVPLDKRQWKRTKTSSTGSRQDEKQHRE